ncbi:uncharacterized protein LOC112523213 [Cynara cardunculus var. scolymus]|uniref:uncharacterized protein LOC112523213 n=1 Tax=Cynara cardunculus var. scolymus TaxID=59895 RepID=UPI000D625B7B|nr:uncharacterized protein LOC112523213 [Cynara cardunculus var. scolymus]XP_024988497.1 uncharacterized protein LOC112523213 [Cynara cardunculus var. scolymus]XP_024988499.1 uncharacterized protein LOC112523213 [Cynara cardunculus var. scolymus]XP_024988500.1 uncharacterized protein LOC112523213 [Cynara cardunculus var. scolymus]
MAKTRSMTRNQNHAASSGKRFKASDDDNSPPWSDLHHELLFLIMMQMGIVDFLAFSGVCKSWRELALANKHRFMASRQPMSIYMSFTGAQNACYLDDFMGRKFKTILPTSTVRMCVGLTSGYLILFGKKKRDFLLVNPITRHELHFPVYPFYVGTKPSRIRAILVYSPSLSGWVFLITIRFSTTVSFSLAGERSCWKYLSCRFPICDIHAFKGKIYMLDVNSRLYETRLNQIPTLMSLKLKNTPDSYLVLPEFVSSGENIYLMGSVSGNLYMVQEVDFDKMKWSYPKNTLGEYTLFLGDSKCSAAIKPSSWDDSQKQFERSAYLYGGYDKTRTASSFTGHMWYFPHDCFNVNLLEE